MYDLSEGAVTIVADGVRQTIECLDTTLETTLRTFADTVAGLRGSGVPAAKSQKVYEALLATLSSQRDARKGVLETVRHLIEIQQQSTQRELDVGCPVPWARSGTTPAARTRKLEDEMPFGVSHS